MSAAVALVPCRSRRALLPLLREIGDLKRLTSAGRSGSIAERAFGRAWAQLAEGRDPEDVALATAASCLAAARLGDLDRETLLALGLSTEEAGEVLREALAAFRDVLPERLLDRLAGALDAPMLAPRASVPPFAAALAAQPRAGVTCPGRARIVLQPAENHAEHCLVVSVYSVLLAEEGCDLGRAFLAGLAHHLHNAAMPDSGFTGEMLLGPHLGPVMERATEAALRQLAPPLRDATRAARRVLPDTGTPEGRAFHAADVIDRVLEIDQHLAAARLTMRQVLDEMALVHDGPVKPFHDRVLDEMGLA